MTQPAAGHPSWKLHANISATLTESKLYQTQWRSAIEQTVRSASELRSAVGAAKPVAYWEAIDAELASAAAAGAALRATALEQQQQQQQQEKEQQHQHQQQMMMMMQLQLHERERQSQQPGGEERGGEEEGGSGSDKLEAAGAARLQRLGKLTPEPEPEPEPEPVPMPVPVPVPMLAPEPEPVKNSRW